MTPYTSKLVKDFVEGDIYRETPDYLWQITKVYQDIRDGETRIYWDTVRLNATVNSRLNNFTFIFPKRWWDTPLNVAVQRKCQPCYDSDCECVFDVVEG